MEMLNKNYKKCPLKKRPVVYEAEQSVYTYNAHQVEEQPQDLSLKRKSSDLLEDYAPPVKREYGLNLSKKTDIDAAVYYRPESPVSVTSEPTALLSPQVKGEHHHFNDYQQPSNIHLRGLTAATAGYTTTATSNPYQTAFVMAAGCNPMSALWHGYQQQTPLDLNMIYPSPASSVQSAASVHSYSYQHMTPPSSPGSEDLASEPEDLSVRSDIPLPALFHHFEETSSYSANSPISSTLASSYARQSHSNHLHSTYQAKSANNRHFKCEKCNRMYATEKGLEKHQVFHCPATLINQEKQQFSCGECGKLYTSNGALKMHIKTHTLPCKCNVCGKAFSRPWLLQGHLRTHTGEKPFACSVCPRRFADRSNLRAHQQTHVEVKKYLCEICNKSFSRASLLKKHNDSSCAITVV